VYQTPTTCNALMRRSAIADVGGFNESFAAMFEDQLFFAKILLHFPVFVSGSCWAKYRQHHTSASILSAAAGSDMATQIRYLERIRHYIRQQRRSPCALRRANRGDQLAVQRMLARLHLRRWAMRMRQAAPVRQRRW
jgi:hypothetical protein